jgi:hypothetical protein
VQHRSLLIFWLLLAATISIGAVAFQLTVTGVYDAGIVLQSLVFGHLSVICIWSRLSGEKPIWRRIATWLSVALAVAVLSIAQVRMQLSELWAGFYWKLTPTIIHAALLLISLWILERMAFWKRRTGVAAKWRMSLGELFTITTIAAILAASFHNSVLSNDGKWTHLAFLGAGSALALASPVIWTLRLHWLLRFSILVSVAMGFGVLFAQVYWGPFAYREEASYFLIQAVILAFWLTFGAILPSDSQGEAAQV